MSTSYARLAAVRATRADSGRPRTASPCRAARRPRRHIETVIFDR